MLLGNESERLRIIEKGEHAAYYLWAPDEMRNQEANIEIPLHTDKGLNDLCEHQCKLMDADEDYSSTKDVLRRVCKSLNRFDWSKIISVTPDFLVAFVDNTGEVDAAADMEIVVPTGRFRELRERGMI